MTWSTRLTQLAIRALATARATVVAPLMAVLLMACGAAGWSVSAASGNPADGDPADNRGRTTALAVTQTQSADVVKKGEQVTYTTSATNTGPETLDHVRAVMLGYQADRIRPVDNPYVSVTSNRGTCEVGRADSHFDYDYHVSSCAIGQLPPGETVQIVAVAVINAAVDHLARVSCPWPCFDEAETADCPPSAGPGSPVLPCQVSGHECTYPPPEGSSGTCDDPGRTVGARTLVDAPPEVRGSEQIKVRGLPTGCVDRDLAFTAKASGAKKLKASFSGPRNVDGGPEDGEGFASRSLGAEKGTKLRRALSAAELNPGYYEIKLAAKYDSKPKQQTLIWLQRCGTMTNPGR